MIEPKLYGQIFGMIRRLARGIGDAIIMNDAGEAVLVYGLPSRRRPISHVHDPMPIKADVRPLLDGSDATFDDPVHVVNKWARASLGLDEDRDAEPGVRFVVPGHYTDSKNIDGRTWWPSFEEAVAAARSEQQPLTWGGHTREFVDLRMSSSYAPFDGVSRGIDTMVIRWEVFPDRVAMQVVHSLTDKKRDDVMNLSVPNGELM
jgi:hypothetical protein